ncbi:alkane hydroxylase MAH1-like [Papaver somniferum]|uniref:alkane hydroxylase MAH1-like n=1 Tax=Papaver somniferum TaxID=3469 RepID=UPI000E6F49AD|nr:alkane hydroxylase MAH1-like [Papaver somniferum]
MDDLSNSFLPAIFILFLICFLSLGLFLKKTSQAIDYRLFLGSFPSLARNSNRLPEWFTEVQRRMAHAALISVEFKDLLSNMSHRVVEDQLVPLLVHAAKTGTTIDLQEVCSRFAFDVNMNTIFGIHANYLSIELPSNDLAEAIGTVQEAGLYRHIMPMFLWKLMRLFGVGREGELIKALKTINTHFFEYISEKQTNMINEVKTFDLLSAYVNSIQKHKRTTTDPSPHKNDEKFLRDSMFSLFVAGKDTIGSGLIWFFWLVSKTPSVEKKILEELKGLVSCLKKGKVIEWPWVFDADDINGLVYLHAALCESLRLYPPVPINSKTVLNEVVLPDGSLIQPGMQILIPFYSVGRMPWIWGEDCLEFRPERWIDDDGKLNRHESKFFTFNLGPRTCLGKDMSFSQMKAVVAAVLFNFQVQVLEGQQVRPKPAITLHMEKGLEVKIQKRAVT